MKKQFFIKFKNMLQAGNFSAYIKTVNVLLPNMVFPGTEIMVNNHDYCYLPVERSNNNGCPAYKGSE
jgi:hypothetical protein